MDLLVFAHTPPPVHGQSVMVQILVTGLGAEPGFRIHHVNPRLSRDSRDIGRWRPGKLVHLLAACLRAWAFRFRHGSACFYYVPAPGKRGALLRDLIVMLLCRPLFPRLILHWHAAGLGEWLDTHATALERGLARSLLGRAALAIVLGEALRADATALGARQIVVIRNGIADPCPDWTPRPRDSNLPTEAVFLGLGARDKGLFDAAKAIEEANAQARAGGHPPFRLRVAGEFPDAATAREFAAVSARAGGAIQHVGFVQGPEKAALLHTADVLIFPTRYAHETQGLVVAEALAFDVPVITTRWRAVAEGLPAEHIHLVDPGRSDQVAAALVQVRRSGSPGGALRRHFLAQFTRERHLAAMAEALRSLEQSRRDLHISRA